MRSAYRSADEGEAPSGATHVLTLYALRDSLQLSDLDVLLVREAPARAPSPAQPFEMIAVDDSPPEETVPPPVPPLSTQVTPLDEEPDVLVPKQPRSLPILLEETPPPIVQRSHSAPGTDTTRPYVDSQSPRRGLLAGHALVFAIGNGNAYMPCP